MNNIDEIKKENYIVPGPFPAIFLSRALGRNKSIYKYIDEIYEENQEKYYNCVIEDKDANIDYKSSFFKTLDFYSELYSKKAYLILAYTIKNSDEYLENKIINIIKMGWKKAFCVTTNKKQINLSMIMKKIINTQKKMTINDAMDLAIVILNLCSFWGIRVDSKDEGYILTIDNMMFDVNKMKGIKHNGCEIMGMDLKKEDLIYIDKIIDKIYGNELMSIENLVFSDKYYFYSNKVANIFDFNETDATEIFNNQIITKRDIQEIIYCYFTKFNKCESIIEKVKIDLDNINLEEVHKFVINNLYIKLLLKEYDKIKKYYFENNKESMLKRVLDLTKGQEDLVLV